jgi:hypothetical protein
MLKLVIREANAKQLEEISCEQEIYILLGN